MRLRLVKRVLASPMNANQMAASLGVDYRTVIHHLDVLQKNGVVVPREAGYARTYAPTPKLLDALPEFAALLEKVD